MITSSITLTDKLTQPALGRFAARAAASAELGQPENVAPTSIRLHAAIVGTTLAAFVALGMATASLIASVASEAPAAKSDRLIADAIQCTVADASNTMLCRAPEYRTTEERSAGLSVLTRTPIDEE